MASGGSISLRVSLAGSEEVKAALAGLGPAGKNALKQIEEAQAAPTAGMRALDAAGEVFSKRVGSIAEESGGLGEILKAVGPAGLAAAAGIGAAVMAADKLVEGTKQAMEFGESLVSSAKAAGVSTTTLQTYRFAMGQAGASTEQADSALRGFTTAFGLAGEGAKKQLGFFEKLGFTQEQLKSFTSVDEALDATVDKISGLGNAADRAAFAKRLGLSDMLPLIQLGTSRIHEMREEAASLGAVMDEHVAEGLAKAAEKFKAASTVIDVQFKSALLDLALILISMIKMIADMAKALDSFGSQFAEVKNRSDQALIARNAEVTADLNRMVEAKGLAFFLDKGTNHGGSQGNAVYATYQARVAERAQIQDELSRRAEEKPAPMTAALGGFEPTGASGPKAPTADEIARNGGAAIAQGAQELANARKAELTAQLALTSDVTARAALQDQIASLENQQAQAARDKVAADKQLQLQQGKITQAAYDQWAGEEFAAYLARQNVEASKRELDARNLSVAQIKQTADAEKADYASKLAALQIQLSLATNAKDRRVLALAIYDLENQEKIAQLQATLAQQQRAGDLVGARLTQINLNSIQSGAAAGRQAVSNANPANGWDAMLVGMRKDVVGLNDEFANMAADGVGAFNRSLFDAQGRLNSLGSIASSVFGQMLAGLEQYLLKQAEIGLFGGGLGGLGSIFGGLLGGGGASGASSSSIMSAMAFGGFADGGRIVGPGGPRSDSILVAVSDGESVINAPATARYWPLIEAMNTGRPLAIPHFANGGLVGGGSGANGVRLAGGAPVNLYVDRRISADGADRAQLQRVIDRQDQMVREEPSRVVAYVAELKRRGFV